MAHWKTPLTEILTNYYRKKMPRIAVITNMLSANDVMKAGDKDILHKQQKCT